MNKGQVFLEYILLLLIVALMAINAFRAFDDKSASTFGRLAEVLSFNLSTGVCERDCFFQGYRNAKR